VITAERLARGLERLRGLRAVFTGIYRRGEWRCGGDSRSGLGSTMERTGVIRAELPRILAELGIDSLLDAGCGDLGWLITVELPLREYVGVDVVGELIEAHRRAHGGAGRRFALADITRDPLPRCDAILCRDALIHLSNRDVARALRNFRASGARWLLATTHAGVEVNIDIRSGSFRLVNLERPPFALPAPRLRIIENPTTMKCLGVWEL
jgi:hypothetical protein